MSLKDIFSDLLGISGPEGASRKLISAVEKNDLFTVRRLVLEQGADIINKHNGEGYTALMQAARYGYTEIADFLIKSGADINKANYNGDTPLILALRGNRTGIIQSLLNSAALLVDRANYQGETALIAAVKYGDIKTVTLVLDKTKNIDKKDYTNKESALSIAARRGFTAIVALLVERGALLDQRDSKGDIPLEAARKNNKPEVVNILQNAAEVRQQIAASEKLRQQSEIATFKQDELKKVLKRRKWPSPQ